MATYPAFVANQNIDFYALAKLKKFTISGTVKNAGVGVIRRILVFKVPSSKAVLYKTTLSDASGNWSVEVVGGDNDTFRVIAEGIAGENSQMFERIVDTA